MRLIGLLIILNVISACSYIPKMDQVLPDKRTDYKKSESLPDLEVPPDLTADAVSGSMAIPNEEASLSQYRQQRSAQTTQQTAAATTAPQGLANEQWVSVAGTTAEVWPRLRTFFDGKGYGLELDDAELGVLETAWSEPVTAGAVLSRYKFKIFSEPGAGPAVTVLFVSSQRQEQVMQNDGTAAWIEGEKSLDTEKLLAGELNIYLNGTRTVATGGTGPAATTAAAGLSRQMAELKTSGDGSLLLSMPEEFTAAWRQTQAAMERAGLVIAGQDQAKGAYYITYFGAGEQEKGGWLSKLKFWKDDEQEKAKSYAVSLTGVGDKTELIVINEKGEWVSNQDAETILSVIQNQYNIR